jgi:hypothetical protein
MWWFHLFMIAGYLAVIAILLPRLSTKPNELLLTQSSQRGGGLRLFER